MALELPTGTVTFLFTDTEGSTRLWQEYPDAMKAALARHDALIHSAVVSHHGSLFKATGDGAIAAFLTAPDAVRAALAAQRAIRAETWEGLPPLRVRMGLHTGHAELRDGDYFGPALNRADRLTAAGHGGQVLLSGAAQELSRDDLPEGTGLKDLGEHRLKDLSRPERLFQLLAPDLPAEFPALRTLDTRPNNLPVQSTPLIGRAAEVDQVRSFLRQGDLRLLTLTGPGGIGKTRLGLQAAADLLDESADGVFFVDLAPIRDPDLVASVVAQTLSLQNLGEGTVREALKAHLRNRRMLLMFDNFEQVVEAAPLVADLLAAASELKVLVTSREPLRLSGEQEYPVSPLSLPDPAYLPPPESLTRFEAFRLFVERARAVKMDFTVTEDNARSIAEICHRLDGLPLAIELAAVQVRLLNPEAILARLEAKLKLLTGGARNAPSRQQTMRQAIDWSHDLLSEDEKALFRSLSIFSGGGTLDAMEAVCGKDGGDVIAVFDGLESLVSKSLLRRQESRRHGTRFTMLETVREYAREQLAGSGGEAELQRRHAAFFLTLTGSVGEMVSGTAAEVKEVYDRLEAEQSNFLAVLDWSSAAGEVETGMRMADEIGFFWFTRCPSVALRDRLVKIVGHPNAAMFPALRAHALLATGIMSQAINDLSVAKALYEEGLSICRGRESDQWFAVVLLNEIGQVLERQGEDAQARAALEKCLGLARGYGMEWFFPNVMHSLGDVLVRQGDFAQARQLYEESLNRFRDQKHVQGFSAVMYGLGVLNRREGNKEAAFDCVKECLVLGNEIDDRRSMCMCLEEFAKVLAEEHPERAATLFGAAEGFRESLGLSIAPSDHTDHEKMVESVRLILGEAWSPAWSKGRRMTQGEAICYAMRMEEM